MITAEQIKKEIADKQCNGDCDKIKCRNCIHWGYNNGKAVNSMGESLCLARKKKVFLYNFAEHLK